MNLLLKDKAKEIGFTRFFMMPVVKSEFAKQTREVLDQA